jgi:hypothetical protein
MEATKRLLSSERGWRTFVTMVFVGAVVVRIASILVDRAGGNDLQIYTYFARLVLEGNNPYDAPADGPIDPRYGDNPVGELGLFAAALWIYDSRTAIRGMFIVADVATLALIAFGYVRSRWWKAQIMVFFAFNPLILHQWSISGDDKTVLFALIVALLVSLERGWLVGAWVAATVLGILKWLSAYFLLPLFLFTCRSRSTRAGLGLLGISLIAIGVTMIPYFPDSLKPIQRRRTRLELDPGHASLTKFLDEVGLYDHRMVTVLTAVAILAITVLFVRSRIDLRETIVLSIAAAFVFLPDQGINRTVFIAVPFLLIMRLTVHKLIAVWAASLVTAGAAVIASERFESAARSGDVPLGTVLTDLVGPFESNRFVLLGNVFLVVVVGLYAFDRVRGRVDTEPAAHALRLKGHVEAGR